MTDLATELRALLDSVDEPEEQAYLEEAIRCCEAQAYKAAVVMTWNVAIHHLRELGLARGLLSRVQERFEEIETEDDLRDKLRDADLLRALKDMGELNNEQYASLDSWRDVRNKCAHPTDYIIHEGEVGKLIHEVVEHVLVRSIRPYAINRWVVLDTIRDTEKLFNESDMAALLKRVEDLNELQQLPYQVWKLFIESDNLEVDDRIFKTWPLLMQRVSEAVEQEGIEEGLMRRMARDAESLHRNKQIHLIRFVLWSTLRSLVEDQQQVIVSKVDMGLQWLHEHQQHDEVPISFLIRAALDGPGEYTDKTLTWLLRWYLNIPDLPENEQDQVRSVFHQVTDEELAVTATVVQNEVAPYLDELLRNNITITAAWQPLATLEDEIQVSHWLTADQASVLQLLHWLEYGAYRNADLTADEEAEIRQAAQRLGDQELQWLLTTPVARLIAKLLLPATSSRVASRIQRILLLLEDERTISGRLDPLDAAFIKLIYWFVEGWQHFRTLSEVERQKMVERAEILGDTDRLNWITRRHVDLWLTDESTYEHDSTLLRLDPTETESIRDVIIILEGTARISRWLSGPQKAFARLMYWLGEGWRQRSLTPGTTTEIEDYVRRLKPAPEIHKWLIKHYYTPLLNTRREHPELAERIDEFLAMLSKTGFTV